LIRIAITARKSIEQLVRHGSDGITILIGLSTGRQASFIESSLARLGSSIANVQAGDYASTIVTRRRVRFWLWFGLWFWFRLGRWCRRWSRSLGWFRILGRFRGLGWFRGFRWFRSLGWFRGLGWFGSLGWFRNLRRRSRW
jgi:hypothetical protein